MSEIAMLRQLAEDNILIRITSTGSKLQDDQSEASRYIRESYVQRLIVSGARCPRHGGKNSATVAIQVHQVTFGNTSYEKRRTPISYGQIPPTQM
jgi:hypothetical protein